MYRWCWLVFLLLCSTAQAHNDWDWIAKEPNFLGPDGAHCCSKDCGPVDPNAITEDNDGASYDGEKLLFDRPGIYWSRDPRPAGEQRPYVCKRHGKLKCIFRVQPLGS